MMTLLKGTHNHYTSILPSPCGVIAEMLLRMFYSGIQIPEDQKAVIARIPEDAIVVYTSKHKNRFDYLFYHTRFRTLGLPIPEISFDYRILSWQSFTRLLRILLAKIDYSLLHRRLPNPYTNGYYAEQMEAGVSGIVFLVEKEGFRKRFIKSRTDPMAYLIDLQRRIQRPIVIVPLLMIFGKNPGRTVPSVVDILFGPEVRPGLLRRWATLFRHPKRILVEVSEPLDLKRYLDRMDGREPAERMASPLRRELLQQVNRHRTSMIGPTVKSREELKEGILTADRLRPFFREYAESTATSMYEVRKKADGYIDEIAANPHIGMIRIFDIIVRFLMNTMFDGTTLDQQGLAKLKRMSQKAPLVLIPCHKSHIDYLILSYVLYHNNMQTPLVAAGKNLSFWPLGPTFRRGGAFFIRRTFKGQRLYARVFSAYIYKVLQEGYNLEFFIEGGRSRTGKMILPKLGLLSIIVDAFKSGACDDLIIAPVYIGYDRVLEESAYLHELEGGKKEAENLKQVIRARRFLKKRYGRVYIKFHEPISVNAFLRKMGADLETADPVEEAALIRNLGHRTINAINQVSVVTPHAVVAGAFLNCSKKRIAHEHLLQHVNTYLNCLAARHATLADTLLVDAERAIQKVIDIYVQRKFIERPEPGKNEEEDENRVYTIIENKRPNLEYYKNNCIAFFVSPAFTALAVLMQDAFQFGTATLADTYVFCRDLMKNEFAYDTDHPPEHFIRKDIDMFVDQAMVVPHPTLPDTYNLTSRGFRSLKLIAAFLTTYFESYLITLAYFRTTKKRHTEMKDRLKKIESVGNRLYKNVEVERKEALSKVYYNNAANYFISRGITGPENEDGIAFFEEKISSALNVLPR
jgi:glycerol-3-phosphate O-acyltransferase